MWAITTLLLGNCDTHGKNLSFFAQHRSIAVAPFYDLVCTALYDSTRIEHDLAMAFGDEFSLTNVKAFALADFCKRLGWPRNAFARELTTLSRLAKHEAAVRVSAWQMREQCAGHPQLDHRACKCHDGDRRRRLDSREGLTPTI